MSTISAESASAQAILDEHSEYLFPSVKPLYEKPVVIKSAQGVWVADPDGREYLDLFAGVLTTSLGHCHPTVVARVQEQIATLGHTSTLYVTEEQAKAARRLSELAPGNLRKTFFTSSGTEAVETAIMLARVYTGRHEIVALRHGYSGRTALANALTAHAPWRPVPSSSSGIVHAVSPYIYRSPLDAGASAQEHEDFFIRDLEETIDTMTDGKPAAFFAETVQGVGGYIVPPEGYFRRAAALIRERGGLFICDEVQAGFGRLGGKWFGIEHWGVEPDIMVMAKGIANGFPVGATIAQPEIADAWTVKTFATFGGNPICMAAADATMQVMAEEDTPANSQARGDQVRKRLDELQTRHSWIGDARGMGLMQAIELVEDRDSKTPSPQKAKQLLEAARDEGLLLGQGGLHGHIIRIGPSMLITAEEVEEALSRLAKVCARVDSADAAN
ncbi:MAG: aspartate aminotransferase family protein [Candidatus Hydrogenedentes bacterium]|jgi:4-aminobutyrate aminotransferase|nr:aspartate aminotransferase family protein [Candidatus Hydrogenedentota bacterium]